MNCCGCKKEINILKNKYELVNGKAPWYGKFRAEECTMVICSDCIKDPEKKKVYMDK